MYSSYTETCCGRIFFMVSNESGYSYYFTSCEVFTPASAGGNSLSDSKSPKVSWTLLSILADINHAVVWMISIFPLISNSACPLSKPLGSVPNAPTIIDITVTHMFHTLFFFSSLARSKYLFIFLLSSISPAGVRQNVKIYLMASSYFLVN